MASKNLIKTMLHFIDPDNYEKLWFNDILDLSVQTKTYSRLLVQTINKNYCVNACKGDVKYIDYNESIDYRMNLLCIDSMINYCYIYVRNCHIVNSIMMYSSASMISFNTNVHKIKLLNNNSNPDFIVKIDKSFIDNKFNLLIVNQRVYDYKTIEEKNKILQDNKNFIDTYKLDVELEQSDINYNKFNYENRD